MAMGTIVKGNTMLTIPDNRIEDYVARGYSIANEAGIVVKPAVPTDIAELQKLYTDHVAKIVNLEKQLKDCAEWKINYDKLMKAYEELEEKNADLEAEVLKLKETPKRTTKKKTE